MSKMQMRGLKILGTDGEAIKLTYQLVLAAGNLLLVVGVGQQH
jgi:hypothetical protein